MGKYKFAVKALSDTYEYFNDGWLPKLRDDIEKSWLRNEECFFAGIIDNGMDQLLYSWLVMMYGDYETSPRGGWITDMLGAVKWLDKFMEDWKNDRD